MSELVKVCVPEGTVLDPFTGSGSTGVAAVRAGRSFLGCELSESYHAVAVKRVSEAAGS